jgi:hypothetical protein
VSYQFLWDEVEGVVAELAVGSANGRMGEGMGAEISWLISSRRASSDGEGFAELVADIEVAGADGVCRCRMMGSVAAMQRTAAAAQ